MEIHLNEIISYFSKPFTCISSLHSLGKYFPQGSLVLFSKPKCSAQETDLDSCHEREYTGCYFRDEVLMVKNFNFSLHCFSSSAEPHCTCWPEEGRVVILSTRSFSEQIVQLVLAPVIFFLPQTLLEVDPPSHLDAGTEQILLGSCTNSAPSQCLTPLSVSSHLFIPCGTIYPQVSPQIAPVLLVLHDEIQLQPQVSLVFCNKCVFSTH